MPHASKYSPADDTVPTAECLLRRVKEVRGYLRREGFSEHAIEYAVTVLCRAAVPYVNGTKICLIENRRAWVFKVALRAAIRAAKREVSTDTVEPAVMAAMVEDQHAIEEQTGVGDWLKQLTKSQSDAVELCILRGMSQRAAAEEMGIAVSTLCGHLSAAKQHLKEILAPLVAA